MRSTALTVCTLVLLLSCKDAGSDPSPAPVITGIQPSLASVGDTIRILGTGFGVTRGTSSVTVGSVAFSVYLSWGASEIHAVVPAGAATGQVIVTVDGQASNAFAVTITTTIPAVSFVNDVQPILNTGCALSGCHQPPGPASGFDQTSYAGVRAGGSKFGASVVVPGDSSASRIVQAMRGTAPGLGRMPFGGPWASTGVPEANIQKIAQWIQEGAANN